MVTYSVTCSMCKNELLIEHAQPLNDPGTLPAFCSNECSKRFGYGLLKPLIDQGAKLIILDCGCFSAVFLSEEGGTTFPWFVCEAAKDNLEKHCLFVHKTAIEKAKQ